MPISSFPGATGMREWGASSELEPTSVLAFEPDEAKALKWLPLAVRYKLDRCGLKLSLDQWRSLPIADRQQLLASREGDAFAGLVFARFGSACEQIDPNRARSFEDYVRSKSKRSHERRNEVTA